MQNAWLRRIVVGLATGVVTLAVGIPVGLAGNCVAGYCLVPVPGVNATTAATRGTVDSYWRDMPNAASADSTLGASRETLLARAGSAFHWGDFGVGIGVAFGSMLGLAVLAAGVLGFRVSRDRTRGQTEPA